MLNLADGNNAILLAVVYATSLNMPENPSNIKIKVAEQLGSEVVKFVYIVSTGWFFHKFSIATVQEQDC